MQIISLATLISIAVTSTQFLGNPATASTLHSIPGKQPGVTKCFCLLRQFHILMNSFDSAGITEIKLRTRTSFVDFRRRILQMITFISLKN